MHSSGSVLQTVLEQLRDAVDHAETDVFTDAKLLSSFLAPALSEMFSAIRLSEECPSYCMLDISITTDLPSIILPPCIGQVKRLVQFDTQGKRTIINEWVPGSQWTRSGPGFYLEENLLSFRPLPSRDETWTIIYTPSGVPSLHMGTGDLTSSTTIELASTPDLGMLDPRAGAYIGSVIRILDTDGHQERIVSGYDSTTRIATFRPALSPVPTLGSVTYEIAPRFNESFLKAWTYAAAIPLAIAKRFERDIRQGLWVIHENAMKAVIDDISSKLGRKARSFDGRTGDSPRRFDQSAYLTFQPGYGIMGW